MKNEVFEDPILDDYEMENETIMISGDDVEENEDTDTTTTVTMDEKSEMEAMVGTFEGVITINNGEMYHTTGDNAWRMRLNLLNAMEQYKMFDEKLRWYVIRDRKTVLSGIWDGHRNRYDKEPKQYYREHKEVKRMICRCVSTGKEYPSYNSAAKEYGVKANQISLAARCGWPTGGEQWVLLDDDGKVIPYVKYTEYQAERKKINNKKKKEVG